MSSGLLNEPLVWRVLGALTFTLYDTSEWQWYHYAIWTALLFVALEILGFLVTAVGRAFRLDAPGKAIPPSAIPLEHFESIDHVYITINKLFTAAFTYHALSFLWHSSLITWAKEDASWLNTAVALAALYIVYDLPYTLFHWALHHPSIYAYVHKHHHRNRVPFRGNLDAINVHPFEFVSGEYNHLAAIYAVAWALQQYSHGTIKLHAGTAAFFVIFGGILASLNHTRFNVSFPIPGLSFIYRVDYHDLHHYRLHYNYGQYIMLWDYIFGTFLAHPGWDAAAAAAAGKTVAAAAADDEAEVQPAPPSSGNKSSRKRKVASS